MASGSRIRPEEVREIAALSRLRLTDDEVAALTSDLDSILGYVAELGELDTSAVEPMTHAVPFDCPLRPDEIQPSLPLEEALANAPRREASFFQVPRIVPGPAGSGGEEDL
ncbi:MAG TPA: Asp-tRNA(Asn)/Glu-tRNA(Gln) amidotransferase subunit GatC [Polyangia bacterium]|nr:Asp-tRNA(Asn)/Glu-tRNA(Gln) amidotransferase subunit GatC [Polyangia bacterium]